MKFGFVIPWADADEVGELAVAAEEHGWDGVFVWEPVWGVDAWISLGLAAVRTTKIRLGTMLTAPSRRRPWETRQPGRHGRSPQRRSSHTLGRPRCARYGNGRRSARSAASRERAELMDECLDIACGLWKGQPFEYSGKHYQVAPTDFPTIGNTIQHPRVPVWCVGAIGHPKSMRRALGWDGLIPQVIDGGTRAPSDARGVGGHP